MFKLLVILFAKKHISTTVIPIASKLGKVVTCHEEVPLIKLIDPSITWFSEVM